MKRWLLRIAALLVVLIVALLGVGWAMNEDIPTGKPGPFADLLAKKMMRAVALDRWNKTGAVAWNFGDRHEHLWDRTRGYARVKWDDYEVTYEVATKRGFVKRGGQDVSGDDAEAAIATAHKKFINDSFWLNPMASLFDDGVTRERLELDGGKQALVVRYAGGGVTPGDAYVWYPGPDFKPKRWKMWVSLLPIGGIEVTWDRYVMLQTGAHVSTKHDWLFPFELKGVRGANNIFGLVDADPFAALGGDAHASSQPSDQLPSSVPAPGPASAPNGL